MDRRSRRREQGSALFVAILMLVMMGFLGIAALETVSRDREVAGVQNRARSAFYAAEAGVAAAREVVRIQIGDETDPIPPGFPTAGAPQVMSAVDLYDRELGALPRFFGDPQPSNPDPCAGGPLCYWKPGPQIRDGEDVSAGGEKAIWKLWRINVVGQSPDGSSVRMEAVEQKRGEDPGGPGTEHLQ